MTTLTEGIALLEEGAKQFGQGLKEYGTLKGGRAVAGEIMKKDKDQFKGGETGQQIAAGTAAMGDVKGAMGAIAEPVSSLNALCAQFFKEGMNDPTKKKAAIEVANLLKAINAAGNRTTTEKPMPSPAEISLGINRFIPALSKVPGLEKIGEGFVFNPIEQEEVKASTGFGKELSKRWPLNKVAGPFITEPSEAKVAVPAGWSNKTYTEWLSKNAALESEGTDESFKELKTRMDAYNNAIKKTLVSDPQIGVRAWTMLDPEQQAMNLGIATTGVRNYFINAGLDEEAKPAEGLVKVGLSSEALYVQRGRQFAGVGGGGAGKATGGGAGETAGDKYTIIQQGGKTYYQDKTTGELFEPGE